VASSAAASTATPLITQRLIPLCRRRAVAVFALRVKSAAAQNGVQRAPVYGLLCGRVRWLVGVCVLRGGLMCSEHIH
jgi:hypothetical protein